MEQEMGTYSSILAWRSLWTEESTTHGVAKSQTHIYFFLASSFCTKISAPFKVLLFLAFPISGTSFSE